jgi:hypothetical protein
MCRAIAARSPGWPAAPMCAPVPTAEGRSCSAISVRHGANGNREASGIPTRKSKATSTVDMSGASGIRSQTGRARSGESTPERCRGDPTRGLT